jgi:transcriptional regulator with GAF, ATPase, and Fis domain
MYLAFNTFDGYLNIIFNNLIECVKTINGDLKSETFDGQPMFRAFKSRLRPPHATFTNIVKEKLQQVISETYASRANVIKYFKKDGDIYHSSVYEVVKAGVTEEGGNMQMIDDENEKNVLNVMKANGIIVADISKFDNITLERFVTRGIKGIIIAPIMDEDNIDGALVLDYMNKDSFDKFCKNKELDKIITEYTDYLKPYIAYPENYKF